ncbi:CoA-transferase [Mycobacterium sp. 852013-50091_SCH5140682]|uniref:CoA-transferase n=1 Tax=Mycobacterium sp. 852013-50091_SCH5140682 TaxID=1834109 RepID=UPI0009ECDF47
MRLSQPGWRGQPQTSSAPFRANQTRGFDGPYRAGQVDLEVIPQGTLAERMRAAGAGIGGFYCPAAVGTPLAERKERKGRRSASSTAARICWSTRFAVMSHSIGAHRADRSRMGNLEYRKTARNFGPVMAALTRQKCA